MARLAAIRVLVSSAGEDTASPLEEYMRKLVDAEESVLIGALIVYPDPDPEQ